MLDCRVIEKRNERVYRLAAFDPRKIEEILVERGIDPESIPSTKDAISGVAIPLSPTEVVDDAFRRRIDQSPQFPIRRFGDGSIGVFYSALEDKTCIAELSHHLSKELDEMGDGTFEHPRYYSSVEVAYYGLTADLRGMEKQFPDLVSETDAGYPFCQGLANQAISRDIEGFVTPSAREPQGTCAPVFSSEALSNPRFEYQGRFVAESGGVQFERL